MLSFLSFILGSISELPYSIPSVGKMAGESQVLEAFNTFDKDHSGILAQTTVNGVPQFHPATNRGGWPCGCSQNHFALVGVPSSRIHYLQSHQPGNSFK